MLKKLSFPILVLGLAGWLSAQEPGAAPMGSETSQSDQQNQQQTLAGMISHVDPSAQHVTLRLSDEFGRVLAVNSNTVILRDGKPAEISDLHTGESATVLTAGDTALRIDVLAQDGGQ